MLEWLLLIDDADVETAFVEVSDVWLEVVETLAGCNAARVAGLLVALLVGTAGFMAKGARLVVVACAEDFMTIATRPANPATVEEVETGTLVTVGLFL